MHYSFADIQCFVDIYFDTWIKELMKRATLSFLYELEWKLSNGQGMYNYILDNVLSFLILCR